MKYLVACLVATFSLAGCQSCRLGTTALAPDVTRPSSAAQHPAHDSSTVSSSATNVATTAPSPSRETSSGPAPSVEIHGGVECLNNVINMSEFDSFPLSSAFARDGVAMVIHRATRGSSHVDRRFSKRAAEVSALGMDLGAYHFAMSEGFTKDKSGQRLFVNDPIEQARHFVNTVKALQPEGRDRVLLVFDLECYGADEKTSISLRSACLAIEEIKRLTGVYPGLYTGAYFINEHMSGLMLAKLWDEQNATTIKTTLGKCWLWIARYERPPSKLPPYAPWQDWTMWQYTTNLKELKSMKINPSPDLRHNIGGVSGEFNYFALHHESFDRWLAQNAWDYKLRGGPSDPLP